MCREVVRFVSYTDTETMAWIFQPYDSVGLNQATYIGETGRNLKTRLTEHKRATKNGDIRNHMSEHHPLTKHKIDWDSAECVTYSTNYYIKKGHVTWVHEMMHGGGGKGGYFD